MPPISAIARQTSVNLSVLMSTVGIPRFSNSMLLSRPLDEQAPQSP
jgi:hypothetical protein